MSKEKISRREFLSKGTLTAGAVGMAFAGIPIKSAEAETPKFSAVDKIQVGLIGCGMRGIPDGEAALTIPGVEIPIVADLYDGRLARAKEVFGPQTEITKDYQEILARKDIDAVIIVTPDHWHEKMAIDAMEAGKDVYLQKPATYRWEEGEEIIKVQKKTKRIVQVGSQGISAPISKLIRKKIENGEIGQVTLVECHNHRNSYIGAWYYPIPLDASPKTCDWERFLGPAPKRPWSADRFFRWRGYWDYSGGLPTDLFVHMVTYVHYIMDVKMAKSVWSTGKIYRFHEAGREVPDQVHAVAEYDDFTLVLTCTNNNKHKVPYITIYGTEGTIVFNRKNFVQYYEPPREDFSFTISTWPEKQQEEYRHIKGLDENGSPYDQLLPEADPVEYSMEMEDTTITHMRNFFQCMRTQKKPIEDMEEGHLAATVAHMVNISQKTGKVIRWDDKKWAVVS